MGYGLEDEMLPILAKAFPTAFFPRGRGCKPLRVGLFEALDATLPPEIDRPRLRLYLAIYTKQPRYLRELTPGAVRIGLNGRPAGRVSAKEAASASARLQPQSAKFGRPLSKTPGARSPASVPVLPSAPQEAFRLDLSDPEAARRTKAAQAKAQKVIVVVKKRKAGQFRPCKMHEFAASCSTR
jgi:ProP effector